MATALIYILRRFGLLFHRMSRIMKAEKQEGKMVMYCTKCGKEAHSGDVYCSGCGSKLGGKKKGKGWLLLLICAAALIVSAVTVFGEKEPATPIETFPSAAEPETISLPEEPRDGDILEDSCYADGSPRREVSDSYGTVYVYDYRPDGTLLRETWLYYSDGRFGGKRVINCDGYGNPSDTTETMADGELWLYLYYKNTYDEQGRPLVLAEYNRMGNPLCIYEYTYNSDGSYTQICTEYRGFVYEYDLEHNPQGTTGIFSRSTTTFTAAGDVIDQHIEELG